jgi:hypothetical protein
MKKDMNYVIIPAAFIIAIILTMVFASSYRGVGPLGGLLLFFLVVFLATWAGQLWIRPFGPIYWGVKWLPLVIVSLVFSLLMVALSPRVPLVRPDPGKDDIHEPRNEKVAALGIFFWVLLAILLISVIVGYFHI